MERNTTRWVGSEGNALRGAIEDIIAAAQLLELFKYLWRIGDSNS